MSKHIYISQNTRESNTSNTIVKKIYNMILQQELTGDVYDNTTDFFGHVALNNPVYKEWADKVTDNFKNLVIESLYYILFKDPVIESIMINYLLSKNIGDGNGITEDNAANINITSIPNFTDNAEIEHFDELIYFTKVTGLGLFNFSNCSNLKTINIQNITSLGKAVFHLCSSLKSIVLNPLIRELPYAVFSNCISLETINTEYITVIGDSAFKNCYSLTSVDLLNCTSLEQSAFASCKSLGTIDITKITTFGNSVFDNCENLQLGDNNHLICTKITQYMFHNCKLISSVYIPNVTEINRMAFNGCTSLTNIYQSSNVTSIGQSAFENCKNLTSIDLSNCTSIDSKAFQNCALLTNINSPQLTTIGQNAFENCKNLTSIDLTNCTSIGSYAFNNCISLTSIDLTNCTNFGRNCFTGCTSLETVILGPNLTQMPIGMFNSCGYIKNIDFQYIEYLDGLSHTTVDFIKPSNNCTSIDGLQYTTIKIGIEIPASVTEIRNLSFATTPYIKFYGTTPPTVITSAFHNFKPDKIIVPRGCTDVYKNAGSEWARFTNYTWEEFDLE